MVSLRMSHRFGRIGSKACSGLDKATNPLLRMRYQSRMGGNPVAIKERRPVLCYGCGVSLGIVQTTLGPEGMKQFRLEAQRLRDAHECKAKLQKAE